MITRMQLLKIANKNSNQKIKAFLHSENIAKKLVLGINYKKIIVRETIFLKNRISLSNCILILKSFKVKPILYGFNYTKINNVTNNLLICKGL